MKIASVPRREGETAFPEIATILVMIRTVRTERAVREREEAKEREWAARLEKINAERAEDGLPPWNSKPVDDKAFIADLTAEVAAKKAAPPIGVKEVRVREVL